MNKKQLIVAWGIALIICSIIITGGFTHWEMSDKLGWYFDKQPGERTITILIILGGLVLYTLRDKKK